MIKIEFVNGKEPLEIEADTIKDAVEKAIREGTDLSGSNLSETDLSWADLRDANLRDANLHEATLYGSNLGGVNLSGADLSGADLSGADLSGADLRDANLHEADLHDANLHEATLYGSNLGGVNLSGADLSGADLSWAGLQGADLSRSNIDFSCLPLRCGSLGVKIDKRIFCQLLYHTLRAGQSVDDPEVKKLFEIPEVVNLANKFHRVKECGKIELKGEKQWKIRNGILSLRLSRWMGIR